MEDGKYKINIDSGNSAFMFCVFISVWITVGDPDIIDALIHFLMK